jgi:hypothetical protein
MIYIKKGQRLFEDTGLVVYSPTGYYNDGDVVLCATYYNPEESVCGYEAKFIAYGGMVYAVSNPEELLEKIKEIDPNTLFGKDSQQVAVDKVVENIVPQNAEQPTDTDKEDITPEVKIEEPINTSTTTPPTITPPEEIIPPINTSTTTPPTITPPEEIIPPINTSTTTPPTITPPEEIIPIYNSTTTPEITNTTSTPSIEY